MSGSLWNLDRVCLSGRDRARLDDLSLQIETGTTAVMGCSGAGKSSLLSLLAGFETPDSGSVTFAPQAAGFAPSESPSSKRLPLFWSPQDHGLWPHLTALEHVAHVLPRSSAAPDADQWLADFGLQEVRNAFPAELSQGERSRLSVARALAADAVAVVLDEPLVHVDAANLDAYWQAIERHLEARTISCVFSTHHPQTVLRFAERVICLDAGRVKFSGLVHELYHSPETRELACLLGPCNWFTPETRTAFGDVFSAPDAAPEAPVCVRPEELLIENDAAGSLIVTQRCRIGGLEELTLQTGANTTAMKISLIVAVANVRISDTNRVRISRLERDFS